MNLGDTILAFATATGHSPRTILRASGEQASELLRHVAELSPHSASQPLRPVTLRMRADDGRLAVLLLQFHSPHSYTGENGFELLLPGGRPIADRVIELFLEAGRRHGIPARLAEPGEFSARAFMNGRMSLDQIEGVAAVISAATTGELAAARAVLDGSTGDRYRRLTAELSELLALVESGIDFTDQEDVRPISAESLERRLVALRGEIATLLGSRYGIERRAGDPRVALVGPPSAGKSTLFNALLGVRRSVVHEAPGTTRDAIAEPVTLRALAGAGPIGVSIRVELVDTPGRDGDITATGPESLAQEASALAARSADVLVACDPSGDFGWLQSLLTNTDDRSTPASTTARQRIVHVRTKGDQLRQQDPDGVIAVCALDGWNLGILRRAIADAASRTDSAPGPAAVVERHRTAMAAAWSAVDSVVGVVQQAAAHQRYAESEIVADGLRAALDHLGTISGRVSSDEILGRIFASFCIGK